jgi:hypothetical protein
MFVWDSQQKTFLHSNTSSAPSSHSWLATEGRWIDRNLTKVEQSELPKTVPVVAHWNYALNLWSVGHTDGDWNLALQNYVHIVTLVSLPENCLLSFGLDEASQLVELESSLMIQTFEVAKMREQLVQHFQTAIIRLLSQLSLDYLKMLACESLTWLDFRGIL